jgi:hypothetical protein
MQGTQEMGEVLAELADNTAGAIMGDKARMTKQEKEMAGKAAGSVCAGRMISPWTVLLLVAAAWIGRIVLKDFLEKQKQKKQKEDERTNSQSDNRGQFTGQNVASSTAVYGGG